MSIRSSWGRRSDWGLQIQKSATIKSGLLDLVSNMALMCTYSEGS